MAERDLLVLMQHSQERRGSVEDENVTVLRWNLRLQKTCRQEEVKPLRPDND
jgi:hypothetical protein